ncbi:palmitoyl-protein thioesterase precursor [Grosmannia clavigera kw1407]|uniref:Palmitoyl-protein thioesterase 1 n=1 Tax=Grosmannia clavigera (strain kw1407 / UAMH 11150) TaxID=655863 RepID=F0X819_GROCL|nr:palmitoyl-protein thioesterase precursor [Grosmannia clavigera kw1407]EFX05214.1 palmitoyl-protein thioesterase precursor [Grosmannia clavigera kw1407]
MALLRQIKLLLTFGSLALASAVTRTSGNDDDDDDDDTPLPLVIWHGLGDNYAAEGLRKVGELADEINPGTLVYFVQLDASASGDRSATFLGNVTEQVAKVCDDIAADPILSTAPAIDALGFSQGGQFLRAYVERCNRPPVRSLVTFGSQHNGITEFVDCGATDFVCRGAMALLRGNTWSGFVQSRLVPAQYFRDPSTPERYVQYLEHSNLLADINNERDVKNTTYRDNMAQLASFAMYMFAEDATVIPKESAWFAEINGTENVPLRARPLYTEDWLGLRALDDQGRLHFRTVPGEHMQIRDKDLVAVFSDFFGPFKKTITPSQQLQDMPGEL